MASARLVIFQSILLSAMLWSALPHAAAQTIGNVTHGAALYSSSRCSGCHNAPPDSRDGSRVYNGVDWGRIKAAIDNTVNASYPGLSYRSGVSQDMAKYGTTGTSPLTDNDLKDISAYICSSVGSTASTCSAPATAPPLATAAPTSIAFGNVQVATASAAKVVTLNNTGGSALQVSSIGFSGTAPGDFSQTNNCGTSLAATTGQCTINVVFTPTIASARAANLVITHNGNNVAGSTSSISLAGTGTPAPSPVLALDRTSLVFGTVLVGQRSPAQAVVLNNSGNAAMALPGSPFSLTGVNAPDFATSHNCPASLPAGANCSVSVTYAPSSAGAGKVATLVIANSSGLPVANVTLSGNAANPTPALQSSVNALAFGVQSIGAQSSLSLTLLNIGTGNVSFASPAFLFGNTAFGQTNNCPATLAVNAQCSVTVTFAPIAAGAVASSLTIASNVTPTKVISVSASGVLPVSNAPQIRLTPASVAFAAQIVNTRSAAQQVTVSNSGSSTLTVSALGFSGTNAADYTLAPGAGACGVTPGAAFSLAVGASCTLFVAYTPLAAGTSLAQLSAASDSVGGLSAVGISGTGLAVPAPIASANTTLLSFGGALVAGSSSAARTVTLTNTGNANLTGTFAVTGSSPGDFVVVSGAGSCVFTGYLLSAGASCQVYVQYQPAVAGNSSGNLVFATNAAVSPVIALAANAGAAPAPVGNLFGAGTWGPVELNQPGVTRTLTLSNDGNAALHVSLIQITGTAASDFSFTTNCTATVAPLQSCTVNIGFVPHGVGARDAMLEVQSSASAQPLTVDLHGTGSANPVLAPASVEPGAASAASVNGAATQSGGAGGCSAGNPANGLLDPTLWALCLASALLLARRRRAWRCAAE